MNTMAPSSSDQPESTNNTTTTTNNEKKVKISVSIIGDAFADLFCYLDDDMPTYGGDVRVNAPVKAVPGGSGLNTATHLRALIGYFDTDQNEPMDVTFQTVLNEEDEYGRLLMQHALDHGFELINCYTDDGRKRERELKRIAIETSQQQPLQEQEEEEGQTNATLHNASSDSNNSNEEDDECCSSDSSSTSNSNNNNNLQTKPQSSESQTPPPATGHCIVIVSHGQERSFMTHLGVMSSFQATDTILHELVNCRSADPTFTNHHHHIHIAGYYNIPGFWNGKMKRRLKIVREKRRNRSHGLNVFTTTTSLVPQYDASEGWDGDLVGLLPMIDFLILNVLEAGKICGISLGVDGAEDGGTALNRAVIFLKMAQLFYSISPNTYVIVTLGKKGAVALFGGEILINADCPKAHESPVDPTGAGDAFAAGFLKGVMAWRVDRMHHQGKGIGSDVVEEGGEVVNATNGSASSWNKAMSSGYDDYDPDLTGSWTEAVIQGMSWGCAMGSAVVMQWGASAPPPKTVMQKYMGLEVEEEETRRLESNSEKIDADGDDMTGLPRPVVFCGPGGDRKDLLMKMIRDELGTDIFGSIVLHTTRKPRDNEVDGVDFHFTDVETIDKEIKEGKFLEFIKMHGHYYATGIQSVKAVQRDNKICVIDVDAEGIQSIKESALDPFYAFIAPLSTESLEFKLTLRGTDEETAVTQSNIVGTEDTEVESNKIFVNDELAATYPALLRQFKEWYPELVKKTET